MKNCHRGGEPLFISKVVYMLCYFLDTVGCLF